MWVRASARTLATGDPVWAEARTHTFHLKEQFEMAPSPLIPGNDSAGTQLRRSWRDLIRG